MKKGIGDVQLVHRPGARHRELKNNANRPRL
jgi:hypothetical protein